MPHIDFPFKSFFDSPHEVQTSRRNNRWIDDDDDDDAVGVGSFFLFLMHDPMLCPEICYTLASLLNCFGSLAGVIAPH